MPGGELSVRARFHQSRRWITVPASIADLQAVYLVLDTGSPVSALSARMSHEVAARGLLHATSNPTRFRLANLTIAGEAIPDLAVAILPRLDRLEIDGLLGLDFLLDFNRIVFDVRTFDLVLEDP